VLECLTLTRSAELLLERRLVRLMNVEGFAKLLEITRNYTRYHAYGRRRLCEITRNYVKLLFHERQMLQAVTECKHFSHIFPLLYI